MNLSLKIIFKLKNNFTKSYFKVAFVLYFVGEYCSIIFRICLNSYHNPFEEKADDTRLNKAERSFQKLK